MFSRIFIAVVARVAIALALLHAGGAYAAEIKVLSTMALRSVMEQLIPEFERASGHRIVIEYDTANIMANRSGPASRSTLRCSRPRCSTSSRSSAARRRAAT